MTQAARIVDAWLCNLRLDYIASTEGISKAEVERIIAKAALVTGKQFTSKVG